MAGETMARNVFYRQCRLVKRTQTGELQQMSWIPDQFAVVGKVLKLRADGVWDNGWVVQLAGHNLLSADQVPDFHEMSKAHLRATGDAETAAKD
jgi:hypothetical protein